MGPSDYWKIAPPHSYIDVNDFATVEELANYLLYLGKIFESLLFPRKVTIICYTKIPMSKAPESERASVGGFSPSSASLDRAEDLKQTND